MKLSVIVPAFNEGDAVRTCRDAIDKVLSAPETHVEHEIIFVDDGSSDDTFEHLQALAAEHSNVRVIKLAMNAGSHMAVRIGLNAARGEMACFVACDLQDPPENIPKMMAALHKPAEIVWAVRKTRSDPWTSRLFSRIFFWLARMIVSKNLPPGGASSFLIGPRGLKTIRMFGERNMTLDGLFAAMGLKIAQVPYERRERIKGTTKWTLAKRLKLFADYFVGQSYVPIRFMSYLGLVIALLGFFYAGFVIANRIFFEAPVGGWPSLMTAILIIGGTQMVMLGVIGEYVWRTLDEARQRPQYLIETTLNEPPEDKK